MNFDFENFAPIDLHFARFMSRLNGSENPELYFAAALVSNQTRAGHICLDLHNLPVENSFSSEQIIKALGRASVVGEPGDTKPLILDAKHRLYLYRYWEYEQKLADYIIRHRQITDPVKNPEEVKLRLEKYFLPDGSEEIDWQKMAAIMALRKRFCVITGGPGTGKTYTVGKILALLLEQAGTANLRIALAAPTGKAAVRLQESIKKVKTQLDCPEFIKESIPEEASTLHRLLGYISQSPYFRYNADNPLQVDVMVVDEASMVDLALMSKLVQALPEEARLILLGDNHQLASVEAGAVLADICGDFDPSSSEFYKNTDYALTTQSDLPFIVKLQKSYRFAAQQGIGALSQAINAGAADEALALLKDSKFMDITWHSIREEDIKPIIKAGFRAYLESETPEQHFAYLDRFRILCAVREGPQGVNTINDQIDKFVRRRQRVRVVEPWYRGQPILITENDYRLNLFNGDVGILLPDPQHNNEMRVYFLDAENKIRKYRPFRLPDFELAYAMTVHKSQGSEYENVLLILPNQDTPILTRELIYTAITRATRSVAIWGDEEIFRLAISRCIVRNSGLRDALWEAG